MQVFEARLRVCLSLSRRRGVTRMYHFKEKKRGGHICPYYACPLNSVYYSIVNGFNEDNIWQRVPRRIPGQPFRPCTRIFLLTPGSESDPISVLLQFEEIQRCGPYDALSYVLGCQRGPVTNSNLARRPARSHSSKPHGRASKPA